jgi:hypothetical protein
MLGRYFLFGVLFAGACWVGAGCVGAGGTGMVTVFPEFDGAEGVTGIGKVVFDGALFAGVGFFVCSSKTVEPKPALRVAMIESESEVIMNRIAEIVVAFESNVAEPRGPNAVCDPIPPNAPARSAAFPLCKRTTIIKKIQTTI